MFQTSIMYLIAEGIRSHTMSVLNERRRMVTLGYNYEEVCLNKGPLSILTYLEKRKLPLTAYIFLCVYVQSCSLTCTILNTSIQDKRKSSDSTSEGEGSPPCSQMKRHKSDHKSDNQSDTEDSRSSNADDNSEEGSGTNGNRQL